MAYQSQRQTLEDRATRRTDKLRVRLGWQAGILNHPGGNPKGMHWQTYWRLRARHDADVLQAFEGMSAKLELAMKRLEQIDLVAAH